MKKRKLPRWLPIVLVAAGIAAVILIGAASHRGGGISVVTATAKQTTLTIKLPENGVVDQPQTATIGAQTGGTIQSIAAHSGQRVSAGDLLMKLDDRQIAATVSGDAAAVAQAQAALINARAKLQADVNSKREGQVTGLVSGSSLGMSGAAQLVQAQQQLQIAQSNARTAQETYQGDLALFKINGVPRQQLDRDRAAFQQAQANEVAAQQQYDLVKQQLHDTAGQLDTQIQADQNGVESAQAGVASAAATMQLHEQQLAATDVRAPFDGVIQTIGTQQSATGGLPVQLAVGDSVTPGQTLFTIAGAGPMIVRAQVDEQDIAGVNVGQRALITGDDFPNRTLEGTVTRIAPVVVQQSSAANAAKNVETTISLAKQYPFLRAGMSCDVDIITGQAKNVLTVPLAALVDDGSKHYVFVVRKGIAHKVQVRKGLANDTLVTITSGLSRGDVVATSNLKMLRDGARVEVSAATPEPSPQST